MSRATRLFTALLLILGAADAGHASAQSALVTQGLGLPVEPMDARSRGLGGVGIGLPDGELSWASPGGLFGLPAPAMVAAYQYDRFETSGLASDLTGSTARLPFLFGAFPASERLVLYGGFGSFLDQNWAVENPDTIEFGDQQIPVLDIASSTGGVTRVRFGATYQVVESLAVGGGLDLYTGGVDRLQGRMFAGESTPACCGSSWTYRGSGFNLGAHWSPSDASGIAIAASYGGTLEATPENEEAEAREYDLPLMLRGGLSGRVGQNTLIAMSGTWDGWSSLDGTAGLEGSTRDAWSVNGGLEWEGTVIRGRPFPLRIGARTGALPFRMAQLGDDGEWAGERAITGGLGVLLGGGTVRADMSIESGKRSGESDSFEESFWRAGFSIRVLGR